MACSIELTRLSSELLTYRQKAVDMMVFGAVGCEPKTVRFLRLQRKAHDSYSTKSERKNWPLFSIIDALRELQPDWFFVYLGCEPKLSAF